MRNLSIIGAGPAGLTLARILQLRARKTTSDFVIHVFESESSFGARDQGGTLDIHSCGGQKALKAAGIFDAFKARCRPEGQAMKILDRDANIHFEEAEDPTDYSRPEIDRKVLRELLIDSLEPGTLVWNKHLEKIEPLENGQHLLLFKDGSQHTTDFLVGADGAWSKVRKLLTPITPEYSGITFIQANIPEPERTLSSQGQAMVGAGSAFILGKNKGFTAQKNGDGSIRIYSMQRLDAANRLERTLDCSNSSRVRQYLYALYAGWHPKILELIAACDDAFIHRPLYEMPLQTFWETKAGVTIIGDAAHVMTPFAGEGANLAMLDALDLANKLTHQTGSDPDRLTQAINDFERSMILRARKASQETLVGLKAFLSDDAPVQAVKLMNGYLHLLSYLNVGAYGKKLLFFSAGAAVGAVAVATTSMFLSQNK